MPQCVSAGSFPLPLSEHASSWEQQPRKADGRLGWPLSPGGWVPVQLVGSWHCPHRPLAIQLQLLFPAPTLGSCGFPALNSPLTLSNLESSLPLTSFLLKSGENLIFFFFSVCSALYLLGQR